MIPLKVGGNTIQLRRIAMKTFKLYWKCGQSETVRGYDFIDACRNAGISQETVSSHLDRYEEEQRARNSRLEMAVSQ